MKDATLILFAHGSRDPRWRDPFERLRDRLVAELGEERVGLAYMEFAAPTLEDVVDRFRSAGRTRVRILPLFLAAGAHVAKDLPRMVDEVSARFPDVRVEVLPPAGEDPRLASLLEQIARESAAGIAPAVPGTIPA